MHFCYLALFQCSAEIITQFTGGHSLLMHEFINMCSFGKIHQDLQSKRVSRDLNGVQVIMNLLKETMVNPVEEKSLMSISSGISPTDKIKDSLGKAYSMGKEVWDISFKKLKLGTFSNTTRRVTVKLRG